MLHQRRFALPCCWMMVLASACTMSSRRPEQLVAPDASVAAAQDESTGKSQSNGTGGAPSSAPANDAGAMKGSGGAMAAPEPMEDAGAAMMPPMPATHPAPSSSDASTPAAPDASADAGPQPLPECAANFAVEVTACYLLDPTNPDCPHLADHCGLIDASANPTATATADGG
jgi:hypothetical protein